MQKCPSPQKASRCDVKSLAVVILFASFGEKSVPTVVWRGPVSAHLLAVAPGNPSCAFPCYENLSASLRFVFAIVYVLMLWCCPVCSLSLLLLATKRGRSGRTFSGVPVLFPNLECYCVPGGGYLGGGSFGSSVPRSPGTTLQRGGAAHGPLHPAVFFSKLCFCVFGILLGLGIRVWEI